MDGWNARMKENPSKTDPIFEDDPEAVADYGSSDEVNLPKSVRLTALVD